MDAPRWGANAPSLVVDGAGHTTVLWRELDEARPVEEGGHYSSAWVSQRAPAGPWSAPRVLAAGEHGDSGAPVAAVDGQGNVTAVWHVRSYGELAEPSVWASRHRPGAGWGSSTPLNAEGAGLAYAARVGVDGAGNVVAAWLENAGQWYRVRSSRYAEGVGWSAPEGIDQLDGFVGDLRLAVSASGSAIAVWGASGFLGDRQQLWANHFDVDEGWGTPLRIDPDGSGDAVFPSIAMDGVGNAVVVWQQQRGDVVRIVAARYTVDAGWSTAGPIDGAEGVAISAQVALDAAGHGIAVFRRSVDRRSSIMAARFSAADGWSAPVALGTDTGEASSPRVALDEAGNGVVVWMQSDVPPPAERIYSAWSNRYIVGEGWGAAELIEHDDSADVAALVVAVGGSGDVVSAWLQSDGRRDGLWLSHGDRLP